jgi:hypothetical protein
MVHFVDHLTSIHSLGTLEGFEIVILVVKTHCTISCDLLIIELKHRLLDHELKNVFMVIYPQY